jgi:hypothetical protein
MSTGNTTSKSGSSSSSKKGEAPVSKLTRLLSTTRVSETAATGRPFVFDSKLGYVKNPMRPESAVLAAAVFAYEGVSPEVVTDADVETARAAYNEAQAAGGESEGELKSLKMAIHQNLIHLNHVTGLGASVLLDLTGCQQVRELSESNIQNFFQSLRLDGAPANVLPFVRYWSAMIPSIATSEGFASRLEESKFVQYHTGASTTPGLCRLVADSVPFKGFFSSEELTLINKAYTERTSLKSARAIPTAALVKTWVWLDLTGRLPDRWYMGQRAVDGFPVVHYKLLTELLKGALGVLSAEKGYTDGDSMDVIAGKVAELIAGSG